MKTFITLALVLAASHPAFATSLHPCTPMVKAADTYITCQQGDFTYSITLETLMSPAIEMCRGKNYAEFQTAKIAEQDSNGKIFEEFNVFSGQFTYTTSPLGNATFASPTLNLNLTLCVSPIHGGVTFGN